MQPFFPRFSRALGATTLAHIAAMALLTSGVFAQQPKPIRPGEYPNGLYLLPNGWRLKPAGKQVELPALPLAARLSPDGKFLAVTAQGLGTPTLVILDAASHQELARTTLPAASMGIAINKAGNRIYVGGGSQPAVSEFSYQNGRLQPARRLDLSGNTQTTARDFVGDVALSPDETLLYVARLHRNGVDVLNLNSGAIASRFGTGRRPYRIVPHPMGNFVYVSSWADGSVYRHRAQDGALVDRTAVGAHTTDMIFVPGRMEQDDADQPGVTPLPYVARLFVTAANTNSAYSLGVEESGALTLHESIPLGLSPNHPIGITPSALAYHAETHRLYVVCSDLNAVAVADVRGTRARGLGFIPMGWYPVSTAILPGGSLFTINQRGNRSYPSAGAASEKGRIAGTATILPAPSDEDLVAHTNTTRSLIRFREEQLIDAGVPNGNPIPSAPGLPSPIKHVIYVVKSGLSYGAVFGASAAAQRRPNQKKLAQEFGSFDNFYSPGDGVTDGLQWVTASMASDYVQRLWPGGEPIASAVGPEVGEVAGLPAGGYLWNGASFAGVTLRNYGFWVENQPRALADGSQVAKVHDPILEKNTNLRYPGLSGTSSDLDRAKAFIAELREFGQKGALPQLLLVRLGAAQPNGEGATDASDQALGMLVEAVSHSPFWKDTAIFVVETNAAPATDAVDSHRSPVLVISPYAKRNAVDSNFYTTNSVLRTIELILGIRPMTQFDAGSSPMWTAFQAQPDTRPYKAANTAD